MQRICHPPASSGNRSLTTQHAVQISSRSETTEHLLTAVELPAGACQLSGPASCRLMNFPFRLAKQTSLYDDGLELIVQQMGVYFVTYGAQPTGCYK